MQGLWLIQLKTCILWLPRKNLCSMSQTYSPRARVTIFLFDIEIRRQSYRSTSDLYSRPTRRPILTEVSIKGRPSAAVAHQPTLGRHSVDTSVDASVDMSTEGGYCTHDLVPMALKINK